MKKLLTALLLGVVGLLASASGFDTTNASTRWGQAGKGIDDVTSVSTYGRVGASQGTLLHVDRWGNLNTVPQGPGIGYFNLNGQLSTHTQTWTTSGQVLAIPLPVANGSVMRFGAVPGAEIIATGSLVSTGSLWIDGTSTTINNAIATQTGGGIVTFVDPFAVGINGVSNINVQTGATLRLGTDWTKRHGWFFGAGNAQMANNSIVEVRSADWTPATDLQVGGNSVAGSITRYIGKPVDGTLYDTADSLHINTGTIELKDKFLLARRGITGTGTVKIEAGSALHTSPNTAYGFQSFAATQTYEIAGDGFDRAGVAKGAVAVKGNARIDGVSMTLTDSARISADIGAGGTSGFNLPLISTATRVLTVGSPAVGATFGDNASALTRLGAANPNLLGPVRVEFGTLQLNVAGAIPNAQYVELTGNGKLDVPLSNFVRSLRSTSQTTAVNIASSNSLFLNNQESTPVAANLTGPGGVVLTQSGGAKGTYMFDRDAVSMTGTFNVTSPNDFGTVRALTTLAGPLTIGGSSAMVVTNVGGVPSRINATTWTLNAGWKVDVPAGLTPGTYTIGSKTAGGAVTPTLGVNNSGGTPTFAWVGNDLRMTIN